MPDTLKSVIFNFIGDNDLINDIHDFEIGYSDVRYEFNKYLSNARIKLYQNSCAENFTVLKRRIKSHLTTNSHDEIDNDFNMSLTNKSRATNIYDY